MPEKKHKRISPYADRMGRFIGQLRDQQGLTLKRLSRGICCYLNKIENGEREAGKLITDAFFQRLGKPIDLFDRILDHEEFAKRTQRQEIISHLHAGNTEKAKECARRYPSDESCVPDQQFLAIAAINCHKLEGMPAQELLPLVTNALLLTQPDFGKVPFDSLLLTRNEGHLLLAHLLLREELEGSAAVADDYRALMRYFKKPKTGMAITALAGPLCNFILAYGMMLLAYICLGIFVVNEVPYSGSAQGILDFCVMTASLSIGLGVFNLIPFPPLDGSKILGVLLPDRVYYKILRYEFAGTIILMALLWLGVLDAPLYAVRSFVSEGLMNLAQWPYDLITTIF